MGVLINIILGIIGAGLATWLFNLMGIQLAAGWLGYLISGFVGACVLILVTRLLRPTQWR
jgi:uncharacterized membrane protein YeaQ/YmgE (transglycosylase-associated protein family)